MAKWLWRMKMGMWVSTHPNCIEINYFTMSKIMSQHNSNYSTTFIILILSKIFTWLNYIFHSIYSNTSPSTKHNLQKNLFWHTLGGLRCTYPFYSSTTILSFSKNYAYQHDSNYSSAHIISMVSKLFLSVNYTFHSIYSNTNPLTKWSWRSKMGMCTSTHPKCVKINFFVNCV